MKWGKTDEQKNNCGGYSEIMKAGDITTEIWHGQPDTENPSRNSPARKTKFKRIS